MKTLTALILLSPAIAWGSITETEMRHIDNAIQENIPEASMRPYFTRLIIAIRTAENGGPGRQFGVLHPKADTFRKQAGWCAAICWKRYEEWKKKPSSSKFLVYLANRYAPVGAKNDPLLLNHNWLLNVRAGMGLPGQWDP
jgi:hypothetical protein